jgi:hypothetical protein
LSLFFFFFNGFLTFLSLLADELSASLGVFSVAVGSAPFLTEMLSVVLID